MFFSIAYSFYVKSHLFFYPLTQHFQKDFLKETVVLLLTGSPTINTHSYQSLPNSGSAVPSEQYLHLQLLLLMIFGFNELVR